MKIENNKITEEYLTAFEEEIANEFNNGKIHAPIHLYNGNEASMINFFSRIRHEDWVFCSWRSHYQCLLKGVPKDILKNEIMSGKSISLCFPDYKIYSSAIVGGSLPIAMGVAFGLKQQNINETVYCFIGDMTAETGIAHETIKFSINHNLPIHFIIEDNGLSVMTDTKKTWNTDKSIFESNCSKHITYYKYINKYPHSGAGKRVEF